MVLKRTKNKMTAKKGKSKQHAKAGYLGGIAPHICRGRECSKMKSKAKSMKKSKAKTTRTTKSRK